MFKVKNTHHIGNGRSCCHAAHCRMAKHHNNSNKNSFSSLTKRASSPACLLFVLTGARDLHARQGPPMNFRYSDIPNGLRRVIPNGVPICLTNCIPNRIPNDTPNDISNDILKVETCGRRFYSYCSTRYHSRTCHLEMCRFNNLV